MIKNNKKRIFINLVYLVSFSTGAVAAEVEPAAAGTWLSILPPLFAITMALALKKVIPALFAGVFLGAWLIQGLTAAGAWSGLLATFEVYVLNALADRDHAAIVLFSLMIGGMVGVISRNGGMQGVVNAIARWADSVRHASLATATMGLAVFFDDYANTLVVGNTMRPVTDSKRISREKLAYLVDSTAAPVSCIALVTTWIGYEVGLIGDSLSQMPGFDMDAYVVFVNTIPYSFYPVLAICFVFMVAASGRDFGPMLAAERRARQQEHVSGGHLDADPHSDGAPIDPIQHKPHRPLNAILPVAALVFGVVGGLYVTGRAAVVSPDPALRDIIGAADSYRALMWGSFLGVFTAALLSLGQRILGLEEIVNAWYRGLRSMLMALIILLLAWSLGETTDILRTADFLVSELGDALPVFLLPTVVFLISAGTAFATGSSWGAMGILIPLVMPLSWAVLQMQAMDTPEHLHVVFSSISAVLAGAVWGDHCSPISDTTILSSLASGCDHIEHVRTQLPYAILVGITGLAAGTLPVAMGMPWWLGMTAGVVILGAWLRLVGRPAD